MGPRRASELRRCSISRPVCITSRCPAAGRSSILMSRSATASLSTSASISSSRTALTPRFSRSHIPLLRSDKDSSTQANQAKCPARVERNLFNVCKQNLGTSIGDARARALRRWLVRYYTGFSPGSHLHAYRRRFAELPTARHARFEHRSESGDSRSGDGSCHEYVLYHRSDYGALLAVGERFHRHCCQSHNSGDGGGHALDVWSSG